MSDPWGSDAPSNTGFDANVAANLVDEVATISTQFEKYYGEIGTRLDTRELRNKLAELRKRSNDTTSRLRNLLNQKCSPALVQKRQEIVQRASDSLQKLHNAEQSCARKEGEVVMVMRESLNQGKRPDEIQLQLQLTTDIKLKEINVDQQIANERNEDLQAINRDLAALAEVQRDITNLVSQQGEMITTAEGNTNNASRDIESGAKDVEESSALMCSYRKKIFIIILIVVIVLAIIAIIIGVVVSKNQSPSPPPPAPVAAPVEAPAVITAPVQPPI